MTTLQYIRLRASDGSLDKKFRVVADSLVPLDDRTRNSRRTLTGKTDSMFGAVFQQASMTLRVGASESDSSYGTLADLRTFYGYNNPCPASGPSTSITYYDNLGASQVVELVGQLSRQNMTPYLDGASAVYLVQIGMETVNA